MENGVNHDGVVSHFIEDFVWKPTDQRVTEIIYGHGKGKRLASNSDYPRFDATQKFFAKPQLAPFIPRICRSDILVGFRSVDDVFKHPATVLAA